MIPGVNPRQMKKMMQRMGIKQIDINADVVIIKSGDKEIIISEPSVVKVNMMGQETFQITGKVSERELEPEISEEDIKTVMQKANVSRKEATQSLKENKGDLAKAILELSSK